MRFRVSTKMTRFSVEDRYFSFNRTLLLTVGLWPYKKSKLHLICFISILSTNIIFQLTTFITTKFSSNLLIKVFSSTCVYISLLIKYNSFCVNSETVKHLMEQLQCFYNNIKDSNEIAIIDTYGNIAKRYTVTLTILVCTGISIIIITQFWPDFYHIILSVNQSRSHGLHIMTEYFIDKEKYFHLLLLHSTAGLCIGLFALLATGTMLIAFLYHACGMFRIASYRIEHAIPIHTLQDIILPNDKMIHKQIVRAVDIHRKAMMFSKYLNTQFEKPFMLLIIFGVISLSLNIFEIFQIITSTHNTEKLFMVAVIITINGLYMFLANLIGQEIIDHNNHIFATAYNIRWYITSIRSQKLILLMLQRGNKLFELNVGGLFIASLQCFATLVNASLSYFTLMYSTQ